MNAGRVISRVLALIAIVVLQPLLLAHAAANWDMKSLSQAPKVYEVHTDEPDVHALYFESVPYKGNPTRVFAYYGIPTGNKLPAMVLIHGGLGTAFAEWVRMWNKRGYAAIAIDTCGVEPGVAPPGKPWDPPTRRHADAGPECWDASFNTTDDPVQDQWTYHAVAAAIRANSLIRSFPQVDPSRVGVTGISWGGYLTDIVAGVDPRFRFAVPVYGCGFLGEDSAWIPDFQRIGPAKAEKWLSLWDPSNYLPNAKMPMLWVSGTNDIHYRFEQLRKSYLLPKGPRTLSIHVRMRHGQVEGAAPEEISVFADSIVRHGVSLVKIVKTKRNSVEFKAEIPVVKAELNFTTDNGPWPDREWKTVPAQLDHEKHSASSKIPAGARAWYFNLVDERGLVVSSEAVIVPSA